MLNGKILAVESYGGTADCVFVVVVIKTCFQTEGEAYSFIDNAEIGDVVVSGEHTVGMTFLEHGHESERGSYEGLIFFTEFAGTCRNIVAYFKSCVIILIYIRFFLITGSDKCI